MGDATAATPSQQEIARSLVDKPSFANAATGKYQFSGMGFCVQTPNMPSGTHGPDMIGTSSNVPSMGTTPEFDEEELEVPGYSSEAFGRDARDAYWPWNQQDWSEGVPPEVAQNAIVSAVWKGYKKASWKWTVEHRLTQGVP